MSQEQWLSLQMALTIKVLELLILTANLSSQPTMDRKLQVTPGVSDPDSVMESLFMLILETNTQGELFATTTEKRKLFTTSKPSMVKNLKTLQERHSLNTHRQAKMGRTSGSGLTTTTLTPSSLHQLTLTVKILTNKVKVLGSSSLESTLLLIMELLVQNTTTLQDRSGLSSMLRTSLKSCLLVKSRKVVITHSMAVGKKIRTKESAG